jgi:hypothetical protein
MFSNEYVTCEESIGFSAIFFAVLVSKDMVNCWRSMAEEDRWARASYHSVSGTVTHSLPRQSACDGRKGGGVLGAKNEECFTAERTWKYASVATTKKKTIVSMGEDAA